jgi:hypothetical protein
MACELDPDLRLVVLDHPGAFGHMVTAFVAHLDKRRRPLA